MEAGVPTLPHLEHHRRGVVAPGFGDRRLDDQAGIEFTGQHLGDAAVPQAIDHQEERWTRERVFRELAADQAGLGGQAGICQAYTQLFGEKAIFAFSAACKSTTDCPGSKDNFCPDRAPATTGVN